jgi:hypothetical protein
MRLSSVSLEMASARTSCSLKSAKRFTASPRWLEGPSIHIRTRLNSQLERFSAGVIDVGASGFVIRRGSGAPVLAAGYRASIGSSLGCFFALQADPCA